MYSLSKIKKAVGMDAISSEMLKHVSKKPFLVLLHKIIQKCWLNGNLLQVVWK